MPELSCRRNPRFPPRRAAGCEKPCRAGDPDDAAAAAAAIECRGDATERRVHAQDPHRFIASPARLEALELPQMAGPRIGTGHAAGKRVRPFCDPLVAKIIVHAGDRPAAIARAQAALQARAIRGLKINLPVLRQMPEMPAYRGGDPHAGLLEGLAGSRVEILRAPACAAAASA